MAESPTISRELTNYPSSLTFEKLRTLGLEHIGELSGSIWNDYNLHDPGITTLELLCYALTDLVFRTNLSTNDLLAQNPIETEENNFFTAAEILSCNPLTELDYRKLLIDIDGIRNAWLRKKTESEVPLCLDKETKQLVAKNTSNSDENQSALQDLCLNGLYEVLLEVEQADAIRENLCEAEGIISQGVLDKVYKKLHAHRNLGEDFVKISVLREENIGICAEIELIPDAEVEGTLLKIYEAIQEFLSPSIRFYSLQELLEKGKKIEDIFEGRPILRNEEDAIESNGFIDTEELARIERREVLYTSDFYRILMEIDEVKAVSSIILTSPAFEKSDPWCLELELNTVYRPVFSPASSTILFQKEGVQLMPDKDGVINQFSKRLANVSKNKLSQNQLDTQVPQGQYRKDLKDYKPIQHEFPLTYRIGPDQLPKNASTRRRAEVLQFKAYLTFFDQLLANFLAQLTEVRELFALKRKGDSITTASQSYFTQVLFQSTDPNANPFRDPMVEQIIWNYNETNFGTDKEGFPLSYEEFQQFLVEPNSLFNLRRDRFLNHLLARFSEDFTEYVLLMFALNKR
ncbi:MAG: hypothetical protein AAGC85_23170, partial [Bacteroidota bacterium]